MTSGGFAAVPISLNIFVSWVALVPSIFWAIGYMIHIRNNEVLCQALVEVKSLEAFVEWKRWYKAAVAGLHIWSWRYSAMMLLVIYYWTANFVLTILRFVTFYFQSSSVASGVSSIQIQQGASNYYRPLFSSGCSLTLFVLMISFLSSRYTRLGLLVANSVPDGPVASPKVLIDDLAMIQRLHGGITIFDVPITVSLGLTFLRLLFISLVLGLLQQWNGA